MYDLIQFVLRVLFRFACLFVAEGILSLQMYWSLSCDHGLLPACKVPLREAVELKPRGCQKPQDGEKLLKK